MKSIKFQNKDMAWEISALIQYPPDFDESLTYPAIISVHPFGSCKEQTSSNIYDAGLAEEGFVVIAYDASFQGESGGSPRFVEDPTQRVKDISHVIDYAVTLPYVDADRIGCIGICGGELQVNELLPASPEVAKSNGLTEASTFYAAALQHVL